MARAPELPEDVRRSVAEQIGERFDPAPGFAPREGSLLGASFRVFVLRRDRIDLDGPISATVEFSGRWHHQIVDQGGERLFARSQQVGDKGLQVEEVVQASLAGAIAAAIRWIDADAANQFDADAEANLLVVPAFYVTAFWLTDRGEDKIVVVDRPNRLQALRLETVYSAGSFLLALAEPPGAFGMPQRG